jgi:hypothetical protein
VIIKKNNLNNKSNIKAEGTPFDTFIECNYIQQYTVQRTEIKKIVFNTFTKKVHKTDYRLVLPSKLYTACLRMNHPF